MLNASIKRTGHTRLIESVNNISESRRCKSRNAVQRTRSDRAADSGGRAHFSRPLRLGNWARAGTGCSRLWPELGRPTRAAVDGWSFSPLPGAVLRPASRAIGRPGRPVEWQFHQAAQRAAPIGPAKHATGSMAGSRQPQPGHHQDAPQNNGGLLVREPNAVAQCWLT